MSPKYGDFSWMKFLPSKPHAQYAYPDALRILNSSSIKAWFVKYAAPNNNYANWNDRICAHIEMKMTYNHSDFSFNDTMNWLRHICINGWESWFETWNANVALWNQMRPRQGDFSFVNDDKLRETYEMFYFIVKREPLVWDMIKTWNLFDADDNIVIQFKNLKNVGWDKWCDNEISKTLSSGQKRVKITNNVNCCWWF